MEVIKYFKNYYQDERKEYSVYPQESGTRNNRLYRRDFVSVLAKFYKNKQVLSEEGIDNSIN